MSNVRSYTDEELLNRVKSLPSFRYIPNDYWIIGVQSNEDEFNTYDDKFYLFCNDNFVMKTTGTTNTGKTGLYNYDSYNKNGVAVIKTDEWYYDLWKHGLHKKKMKALVQHGLISYYRDNNKDDKVQEVGKLYKGNIGINFHTNSYNTSDDSVSNKIDGWSLGCQVVNNKRDYYEILDLLKKQTLITYCLLKEF